MRKGSAVAVIISALLSACSAAHSATPDSANPAHCIAAFNYGAYWFKVGHRDRGIRDMYVRGAYEMEKWKAAGRSAHEALAEAKDLTQRYVGDHEGMMRLFAQCGKAQDADPKFRQAQSRIVSRLQASGGS